MIYFGHSPVRRLLAIAPFLLTGLSVTFGSHTYALPASDLALNYETIHQKDGGPPTPEAAADGTVSDPEETIPDAGLVVMASPYSVAETGDRFEALLTERGVTVFARIDHAEGAAGVDLELRPTEVIIFGNPQVGTPLMQCAQSMAIDLPQKLLIWQNEAGDVYLGYNDPHYLAERHGIVGCEDAIARVEQVLMGLTNAVVGGAVEE